MPVYKQVILVAQTLVKLRFDVQSQNFAPKLKSQRTKKTCANEPKDSFGQTIIMAEIRVLEVKLKDLLQYYATLGFRVVQES